MSVSSNMAIGQGHDQDANSTGTDNVDEDVHGTTIPQSSQAKRNAFSELMSPSKRRPKLSTNPSSSVSISPVRANLTFQGREGLGAYIAAPDDFPVSRVLYHTEDFVVINDLFPKSSVHVLVIPRHALTKVHPLLAFEQDSQLLHSTKEEVGKVKKLVASELRRMFGSFSQKDQARKRAIETTVEGEDGSLPVSETLPKGRDWESEVLTGIHSGPSMNHLHVHVLSRDRVSDCMRHRKHYNSFATRFMVGLEEFPLDAGDVRRQPDHGGYLKYDMRCWRCGKNFRNRFRELKQHLDEEFEGWKRE